MKKTIIAFMLCIVSTMCFGQHTKIGSYSCSYFDKEFDVYFSQSAGYMVQVRAERESTSMYVIIEKNQINRFLSALAEAKTKYTEWTNVAKENNIDDFDKNMDITFPSTTVAWIGSDTWVDLSVKPEPRFLVKDGDYLCLLFSGKKVTASDNRYIDNSVYWVFSSPKEMEELYNLLSPDAINKINEEKSKTDELFH